MALPPLELFSLEEEAALLPGGLFVFPRRLYNPKRFVQKECADVAQLVEQLIRNQQVIGSSPIVGSINSTVSGLQQVGCHSTQVQKTQAFPFLVPASSLVPDYPLFFSSTPCDVVEPLRIIASEAEV